MAQRSIPVGILWSLAYMGRRGLGLAAIQQRINWRLYQPQDLRDLLTFGYMCQRGERFYLTDRGLMLLRTRFPKARVHL